MHDNRLTRIAAKLLGYFARPKRNLADRSVVRYFINHFNGDDGQNADERTNNLGFGFIHYALLRNTRPARILCVGSRKGFIPAICALACRDNRYGTVDFVDAGYDRTDENHWSGIGWWKQVDPDRHFKPYGINRYINTFVMTTERFAKRFPKRRYDYVYIDGDHSYRGSKLDVRLFWPKLNKFGFMVFHDVHVRYTEDLGTFGVWKTWKEIKSPAKILFPFPEDSGLGIVQKMQ